MSIFRKKDVGLAQTEMKRHLTLRDVVLLGIGAMVGTGIFTITGTAASTLAGPDYFSLDFSRVCWDVSDFLCRVCLTLPISRWCLRLSLCCLGRVSCLDGWLVDHDCLYECRIQCCLWLGCLPQGATS